MMFARVWIVVLATLALAPAVLHAQPDLPDHFAIDPVVLDPFDSSPTAFAFLPDGRFLVVEKDSARVRLATPASTASVVIGTVPGVTIQLERGLLGVAVDPEWPARPYVYVHATRTTGTIHVTMYTASGDLADPGSTNLVLQSPYTLLDDIPDLAPTHNGGTLRFGPDGMLYVSLGEDVRACEAQDLALPRGKILRLDVSAMPGMAPGPPPKSAITPADNPFDGGEWQRLVWAFGLRNPFRFTVDPQTGDLFIGDVGHLTWEEIDHQVHAAGGGENFGWPEFEATLQDPLTGATDCSTPPFTPPIAQYPNPPGAGVASVICGPRMRTGPYDVYPFPRAYEGNLFYADFYGGWIRRLQSESGVWSLADSVAGQPSASRWASIPGQIVDLQQGPDGALYVLTFTHAVQRGLYRIRSTLPSAAGEGAPLDLRAVRCFPNPGSAGRGLRFRFAPTAVGPAEVRIYDTAGRLVQTLHAPPGAGAAAWDGRTRTGHTAAAGAYVFTVRPAQAPPMHGKFVLAPAR